MAAEAITFLKGHHALDEARFRLVIKAREFVSPGSNDHRATLKLLKQESQKLYSAQENPVNPVKDDCFKWLNLTTSEIQNQFENFRNFAVGTKITGAISLLGMNLLLSNSDLLVNFPPEKIVLTTLLIGVWSAITDRLVKNGAQRRLALANGVTNLLNLALSSSKGDNKFNADEFLSEQIPALDNVHSTNIFNKTQGLVTEKI